MDENMQLRKTLFLLLLTLFALPLAGCTTVAPDLDAQDQIAIYAAAVRQLYTVDDTFGGTLQPPVLYIVATTEDVSGDPDLDAGDPTPIPAAVQSGVSAALADLPTTIRWVDSREEVDLDPETGEVVGGGAIVTLGNILPESETRALVPAGIYIANLAAGGQTYVVEQQDGTWSVTGTTGVQWIS